MPAGITRYMSVSLHCGWNHVSAAKLYIPYATLRYLLRQNVSMRSGKMSSSPRTAAATAFLTSYELTAPSRSETGSDSHGEAA